MFALQQTCIIMAVVIIIPIIIAVVIVTTIPPATVEGLWECAGVPAPPWLPHCPRCCAACCCIPALQGPALQRGRRLQTPPERGGQSIECLLVDTHIQCMPTIRRVFCIADALSFSSSAVNLEKKTGEKSPSFHHAPQLQLEANPTAASHRG